MRKIYKILGVRILLIVAVLTYFFFRSKPATNVDFGLTFSNHEAQGLGFDWKQMYLDMLNDLKPKHLRLMAYWEDTEQTRGQYDFTIIDQELQEAQKQNIDVLVVVGRKEPRWPECHEPDWFKSLNSAEKDQAVL